jgi:pSer/pThr/pTyr-binding forkhead associated (FHA) protein
MTKSLIKIGRSRVADICLGNYSDSTNFMSRDHCHVTCLQTPDKQTRFILTNFGKNGTQVSKRMVSLEVVFDLVALLRDFEEIVMKSDEQLFGYSLYSGVDVQYFYDSATLADGAVIGIGNVELLFHVLPPQ